LLSLWVKERQRGVRNAKIVVQNQMQKILLRAASHRFLLLMAGKGDERA